MDQIMVDVRKRKTLPTFVPAEPSGLDQPNISRTTAADFPDGQFELPITELDLFRQGNVSIHIMGTEWCNLKCPHCYAPYAPDRGMTANQIDHVVNEVEATGLEKYWYDLSGGEIMGNREWPQIFDRLLSTGKDVSVNTNGTLVTDENVGILKDLDTRYPDKLFLSVSLDSEDPETNEKTRPGAASKNVYHGMELLKKNDIRFRAALTLTGRNIDSIEDTVRFVVNNYTREFIIGIIRPVFPMTAENQDIVVPLNKAREVMKRVSGMKEELGDFDFYHCFDGNGDTFCEAGRDRIAIKANGDITACYALQTDRDTIGNIFEEPLTGILRKMDAIHKGRDSTVLLCEMQDDIWGTPPHRLGKMPPTN
jgi:MoaA/NifB/PqqE/SkfB family radical SAM enzyme